mgnify:CR=1 FL=1
MAEKKFVCTIKENEIITLKNYKFNGTCVVKVDKDSGSGELVVGDYLDNNPTRVTWSDGNDMYEIARTLLAGLLRIGEVREDMTVKEIVGEYGIEEKLDGEKLRGFGYYKEV